MSSTIPSEYTCDRDDISPPLQWESPPPGTKIYALIVDDINAPNGISNHWILFNIPSESRAFLTNL
ncbi:MAG: hypothetical protein HC903_09110 [Methylacidiphilales bacterium]|nr:hypothetical protein [Candidatus Methylacidiphilales bacterium]NJR16487.1 hypothetical protein [Calothrix sp. CSU_2_0]